MNHETEVTSNFYGYHIYVSFLRGAVLVER